MFEDCNGIKIQKLRANYKSHENPQHFYFPGGKDSCSSIMYIFNREKIGY